jgi:hypothetical protein
MTDEPEPVTRYFGPPQLRKEWEQQIDTRSVRCACCARS